ncbi:MAG: PKD domain-containing protein, partial [Saprospiraceae bacterium]|nr:PKD domain-containing protein [Saprospiraceae bacterium]
GNGYKFTASELPLYQIAGAPQAYWTYYWEFGDGSFSFDNDPVHIYEHPGNYSPLLEVTAHYDDGDKPKGKMGTAVAERSGTPTDGFPTVFDSTRIPIKMKAIRQARANEGLVCILSYRNLGKVTTDGRLHLFYNEKRYPDAHFSLDSARMHFGESVENLDVSLNLPAATDMTEGWAAVLPKGDATGFNTWKTADYPPASILENLLSAGRDLYREEKVWRFNGLKPGENRNMFISLQGTEKMLRDTNAFIYLDAVFAPFDPAVAPEVYRMEIEIVSSHDPNAIAVSDNRINYRTLGNKKIDYKVKFQNNGEGPASKVEVTIQIPEGLDMKRMKPTAWEPKCPICPKTPTKASCLDTASTKNELIFTFRNIYLPGSRQEGVDDKDSTKGMIKYRIEAAKNMPKRPFSSRAKIVFDKNPPIYTNFTKTRFKVGVSPGIKAGWAFHPDSISQGYAFLGASLSPFKSWRVYPQVELLTGIKGKGNSIETKTETYDGLDTVGVDFDVFFATTTIKTTATRFYSFELPIQLRKNFNRWIGLGAGGSVRAIFKTTEFELKKTLEERTWRYDSMLGYGNIFAQNPTSVATSSGAEKSRQFRYTAFADLTLGSVRVGPNLGIRAGGVFGQKGGIQPFVQASVEIKL